MSNPDWKRRCNFNYEIWHLGSGNLMDTMDGRSKGERLDDAITMIHDFVDQNGPGCTYDEIGLLINNHGTSLLNMYGMLLRLVVETYRSDDVFRAWLRDNYDNL